MYIVTFVGLEEASGRCRKSREESEEKSVNGRITVSRTTSLSLGQCTRHRATGSIREMEKK